MKIEDFSKGTIHFRRSFQNCVFLTSLPVGFHLKLLNSSHLGTSNIENTPLHSTPPHTHTQTQIQTQTQTQTHTHTHIHTHARTHTKEIKGVFT